MEYIQTIIGLAVLSGPLWLIALIVTVALIAAVYVSRRFQGAGSRLGIGLSVLLVVFLALFGDEIAGRMYLKHLCEKEAGVKVYQTVEIQAEYWDMNGKPKFYDSKNGNLQLPIDNLEWVSATEDYSFSIEKRTSKMKYKSTEIILNERTMFRYWGGWIARSFNIHNAAKSCGSDMNSYTDYIGKIFTQPVTGR